MTMKNKSTKSVSSIQVNHLHLWPYYSILQIGGTEFLGFDPVSDLLIVCSSMGLGNIS